MHKIPATVITGFLGAGKTTLIRHLLENAGGKRLALLINEFGDVGVDAGLVQGCNDDACGVDDIVELANGCICCTVADEFLPAMEKLLDRTDNPPDHIIIETSGLALPKPLVKAFRWPSIRSRTTVDGVVTLIDAEAVAAGRFAADEEAVAAARRTDPGLDHDTPLQELFEDQLSCADILVLNKADLVSRAALQEVKAALARDVRPHVPIVTTSHGALDPAIFLGLSAAAEDDLGARPSHHDNEDDDHDHDAFRSLVANGESVANVERLLATLTGIAQQHEILRLKGTVAVEGKPARLVIQAVGPRIQHYYGRPWEAGEPRASQLVAIGASTLDAPAVAAALREALS